MIYLHIGRHKTGTSRLQYFLAQNRQRLADLGVDYPFIEDSQLAHHSVALYLLDHLAKDSEAAIKGENDMATLQEHFDTFKGNFVISSEAFQNIQAQNSRALVGDRETTIVCYFREQASYVLSSYSQSIIGANNYGSFLDHAKRFYTDVNYYRDASSWTNIYGVDAVRLRAFDRKQLVNEDICYDFLHVLDLTDSAADFDHTIKAYGDSVYGDLLKMKMALNKSGYDAPTYQSRVVYWLRELARENPEYSSQPQLSKEFVDQFRGFYQEQNAALFGEFEIENASQFRLQDLTQKHNESPLDDEVCIDHSFDYHQIPHARRILDDLYVKDAEVAKLFEQALLVNNIQVD